MNGLMTIAQERYIEGLIKTKKISEEDMLNLELGSISIYSTTKAEASEIIKFLLTCENKTSEEKELNDIRRNIYNIISKKKTKKGQKLLEEINKTLNKNLWAKGQEETLSNEELLKVKDIKY